jgi:hypothetical protein
MHEQICLVNKTRDSDNDHIGINSTLRRGGGESVEGLGCGLAKMVLARNLGVS